MRWSIAVLGLKVVGAGACSIVSIGRVTSARTWRHGSPVAVSRYVAARSLCAVSDGVGHGATCR